MSTPAALLPVTLPGGLRGYRLAGFPLWHVFMSRAGGASGAPYTGLNTAWRTEDPAAPANRAQLLAALGIAAAPLRLLNPVAGEVSCHLAAADWAAAREGVLLGTDAALTDTPDTHLMMSTADCIPLLLIHAHAGAGAGGGQILALVHLGWRNLVAGLAGKMVAEVGRHYGVAPGEILAGLGPAIRPCCYVHPDPVQRHDPFWQPYLAPRGEGRYAIDLPGALKAELLAAGLRPERILDPAICTGCHAEFYSCYREGYRSGRFATVAGLRPAVAEDGMASTQPRGFP
jgi:hypothetical protein